MSPVIQADLPYYTFYYGHDLNIEILSSSKKRINLLGQI